MRWQRLTLMMLLALMTRKTWARRLRRRFTASNLQSSRWVGRHRTHLMERIDVHLEINFGLAASPRYCARLSYWPTPPVHSFHLVNCAKLLAGFLSKTATFEASSGRENRNPWPFSEDHSLRSFACSPVSTPSAVTARPSDFAIEI